VQACERQIAALRTELSKAHKAIQQPAGKPETDARPDIAVRRRFGQRPKPARIHLQHHGFGAAVIFIDLNNLKFSGTNLTGVKQEDVDLLEHQ
jgi:hypothetical protein